MNAIPGKVLIKAQGPVKAGLGVRLRFEMSKKNHYYYDAYLDEKGVAEVSRSQLLREFDKARELFIMDYMNPRAVFTGTIHAHVLSKDEIEKGIEAYNTFGKNYQYPTAYLETLKHALNVNLECGSRCSVSIVQVPASDADMAADQPDESNSSKTTSTPFPRQAAKGSWASCVIIFFLLMFSTVGARLVFEIISLLLMLAGIGLGIAALFGIPKYGRTGILLPALIGIILNGLLLFNFITNFIAARAVHIR
jgi:hypothetical protein